MKWLPLERHNMSSKACIMDVHKAAIKDNIKNFIQLCWTKPSSYVEQNLVKQEMHVYLPNQ